MNRRRAWMALLALVACGDDHAGNADAPGSVDAPRHTVTVAVTAFGLPAAGVQVYFQDADSVIVAGGSALTGSDGSVRAATPDGGFVTVVVPPAYSGPRLLTIAGVEPDDVLHLEIIGSPAAGSAISIDVVTPTDPTAGVTGYQLYTTCSTGIAVSPIATAHVTLTGCAGGLVDMLVMTTDGSGRVVDSLYDAGVPVGSDRITLTGSYAPVSALSSVITDFTAAPDAVAASVTLVTPHGEIYGVGSSSSQQPIGSAAALPFAWPTIPAGEALTTFDVLAGSRPGDSRTIAQYGPSSAQPVTIDFATSKLRDVATGPTFDLPTRTFAWTLDDTGVTPDVELAFFEVTRGSGSAAPAWSWEILGPGGDDARVVLPALPTEPFDFNIQPDDSVTLESVQGAASPGGAGGLRRLGFANRPQELFEMAGTTLFSLSYGSGAPLLAQPRLLSKQLP